MYIDSQSIGGLSRMILTVELAKALEKTPHNEAKEIVLAEVELGESDTYVGLATQFSTSDLDAGERATERAVRLISLNGGFSSGDDHGEFETFEVEFGELAPNGTAGEPEQFLRRATLEFTEGSSSNDPEIAEKLRPLSEQKLAILGAAVKDWLLDGVAPGSVVTSELERIQSHFPS